ncbi:MAG TPA: PaaI family thioesterase [Xanthobacteraceae bacterium]|nr:PaaI family thioesterase [Xanthobacteraceae bacterium]
MSEQLTPEHVERLLTRGPFNQWLGIKVLAVNADGIELRATWREEWVVNPDRRYTHGGILAALVDVAADWALVTRTGRGVPTIDMRVDYHAAAMPGDLIARGRIVKWGNQFSTADGQVFDLEGKLLASGRGTYLTATPKG